MLNTCLPSHTAEIVVLPNMAKFWLADQRGWQIREVRSELRNPEVAVMPLLGVCEIDSDDVG